MIFALIISKSIIFFRFLFDPIIFLPLPVQSLLLSFCPHHFLSIDLQNLISFDLNHLNKIFKGNFIGFIFQAIHFGIYGDKSFGSWLFWLELLFVILHQHGYLLGEETGLEELIKFFCMEIVVFIVELF